MNPALKDTNVANVACRTSKFKKQKQKQNMIGNGKKKKHYNVALGKCAFGLVYTIHLPKSCTGVTAEYPATIVLDSICAHVSEMV